MYYQFFGISKNPFNMTPDPEFLYLTSQHREALAGLTYAILGQKGFLVLTGEAGTGKTTLLQKVLQHLPPSRIKSSVILNPTLTAAEFLEMALLDFGISEVPTSKAQRLVMLQQLLVKADDEKRICALIVDEAHKLSAEVLEEIRLLGNFERSDHKLLQILFLGQNELGDLLNRPDLRQLKQRVAARFSIGALADAEVELYIGYRWKKAGGKQGAPFSAESLDRIIRFSKGIPRVINAICDNALIQAFGEGASAVEASHVLESCLALDLVSPSRPVPPATPPTAAPPTVAPPTALPTVPLPPNAPAPLSLPSLDRYRDRAPSRSLFARWVQKLHLAN